MLNNSHHQTKFPKEPSRVDKSSPITSFSKNFLAFELKRKRKGGEIIEETSLSYNRSLLGHIGIMWLMIEDFKSISTTTKPSRGNKNNTVG